MAHLSWPGILKDLTEALEQELNAAINLARRNASIEAEREPHAIRLSVELRTRPGNAAPQSSALDVEQARAERDRVLAMLQGALDDQHALKAGMASADQARKAAESSVRKLRARIKELEAGPATTAGTRPDASLPQTGLQSTLDALRAELERERIARAAAEATLAFAVRSRQRIEHEADMTRESAEAAQEELQEARRLTVDLQAEVSELWRVLRETRPADAFSISFAASDGDRRQGMERVQSKIVDARELFRRRQNHRWPKAM